MAYVITGATGHIGNNLVKMLVKEQRDVRVIIRKEDVSLKDLPIEYVFGNFYDEEIMSKSIKKDDIVIHLAAYIDLKNRKKSMTYFINEEATKIIARYSYKVGVKKFVFASSVDAMYKKNLDVVREMDFLDTSHLKNYYPISKANATNFLIDFKKENEDFNLAIFYPSACIGVNDYKPSAIGKVVKDVILGKMEFGISGGYNFVDVRDVSRGVISLCDKDKQGSYLFTGHPVSIMELYTILNKELGVHKLKIKVPLAIVKLAIPWIPYLSRYTLEMIQDNFNYSSEKAIEELDYVARPFSETIKDTINWFKEN